jgi:hypothetical protein
LIFTDFHGKMVFKRKKKVWEGAHRSGRPENAAFREWEKVLLLLPGLRRAVFEAV